MSLWAHDDDLWTGQQMAEQILQAFPPGPSAIAELPRD